MKSLFLFLCIYQSTFASEEYLKILDRVNNQELVSEIDSCPTEEKMSKSVSKEKEKKLFKEVSALDLLYDYPEVGCEDRAHGMGDYLESQGIEFEKIVSFPEKGKLLYPRQVDGLIDGFQGWHFHVAVVINVEEAGGGTVKKVFDPSLAKKSLTINEWKKKQNLKSKVTTKIKGPLFLEPEREFANNSEKKSYSNHLPSIMEGYKECKMIKEVDPFLWDKHCYNK